MRLRRDPHSLAGPYALDALDAGERDRFERHMERCPRCQDEVRRMSQTATALAMAAAADPPAGLKERVLAAVAVTPQLPAGTAPERAPGRAAAPRPARLYPRLATAVAAVAIVVAAVLGGLLAATQHQLDSAQARNQQIAAVLAAPDARIVTSPVTGGGTATVVVSRTEDTLVFTSSDLPALQPDKVYQLWLIGTGGARSAGLVPEASAGRTAPVLASGLKAGDKLGMTVEPSGGTSSPTTTPILVMPLPE
jgi:anti-sigma-K factor RskA